VGAAVELSDHPILDVVQCLFEISSISDRLMFRLGRRLFTIPTTALKRAAPRIGFRAT